MSYNVDGSGNIVLVSAPLTRVVSLDGLPVVVVRLADKTDHGYLAVVKPEGGFGTDECPSSYGRPCLSWFGPGELCADVAQAIKETTISTV